jgi:hypothetical protein
LARNSEVIRSQTCPEGFAVDKEFGKFSLGELGVQFVSEAKDNSGVLYSESVENALQPKDN